MSVYLVNAHGTAVMKIPPYVQSSRLSYLPPCIFFIPGRSSPLVKSLLNSSGTLCQTLLVHYTTSSCSITSPCILSQKSMQGMCHAWGKRPAKKKFEYIVPRCLSLSEVYKLISGKWANAETKCVEETWTLLNLFESLWWNSSKSPGKCVLKEFIPKLVYPKAVALM